MINKELNLNQIIKLIIQSKLLFIIIFIIISVASIFYVLNIEESYKSSLVIKMPLSEGVETEYQISSLSKLNSKQINDLLLLNEKEIKIINLDIQEIKHQRSSTLGVVNFISNKPDLDNIIKNHFISYMNSLPFFKKLLELENKKNEDIIKVANEQYTYLKDSHTKLLSSNNEIVTNGPIFIKEKMHEYLTKKAFLNTIVEISYNTSPKKFKPNYEMLIMLSLIFSFFVSFTIVLIKSIFSVNN